MAKRSRGHTSRPGQRPPLQRQAARSSAPSAPPPPPATVARTAPATVDPDALTDAEEARAAQLEAAIVAEERKAESASRKVTTARSVEPAVRASTLEVSAAEEYAYVARDVRRIALVGGSLVGILFALWVIVTVTGIGPF